MQLARPDPVVCDPVVCSEAATMIVLKNLVRTFKLNTMLVLMLTIGHVFGQGPISTPREPNFSPEYDQGLAPLRPCYSKHIKELDDGKIAPRDFAKVLMTKCSNETRAVVKTMVYEWKNTTETGAYSTIEGWATGVVEWTRGQGKR